MDTLEVIHGGRGFGKTYQLLKLIDGTRDIILVAYEMHRTVILNMIKEHHFDIGPDQIWVPPIIWPQCRATWRSSRRYYVDNLENFFSHAIGVPLDGFTFTGSLHDKKLGSLTGSSSMGRRNVPKLSSSHAPTTPRPPGWRPVPALGWITSIVHGGEAIVIDQRVVQGNNDVLIQRACELWLPPNGLLLDPTWGRGLWWRWAGNAIQARLHTHDIELDGVDFRHLPEADGTFDAVFFDPPYVSIGGVETTKLPDFLNRYGMGMTKGHKALFAMNIAGLAECARVAQRRGRIFMKCGDFVESGKFVQGHRIMVEAGLSLGLEQVDEFVHASGTGPQPLKNRDGTPRKQVHSRRAHTFLVVFKKR